MRLLLLLEVLAVLLLPGLALAQAANEWTGFPETEKNVSSEATGIPPESQAEGDEASELTPEERDALEAAEAAAEAEVPSPAPAADTATAKKVAPSAPAPADERAAQTPAPAPAGQERMLLMPVPNPHSPSTHRRSWNAPENRRYSPSLLGSVGVLHVTSADVGRPGVLRLGITGEYFRMQDFPVRDARHRRGAGTFALSYSPMPFLEAHVAYRVTENHNSRLAPPLVQSLGDVAFGVKLASRVVNGVHLGVDLSAHSNAGPAALGFMPSLVATWDVRSLARNVPLVAHLNVGGRFDGSGKIAPGRHVLNASEEYALGANAYDRLTLGAALEAPLPWVTPFLEYNLARPMGVTDGKLVGPDGRVLSVGSAMPQTLGMGLKVTAVRNFTFTAAMDFGMSRHVGLGVPATAPWNLLLGAAFNVEPFADTEMRVVERSPPAKVVPALPQTSRVGGVVTDLATGEPVSGAIISLEGTGLPPVASESGTGRFLTQDLPRGPVRLVVRKEGYKDAVHELTLEGTQVPNAELKLSPLPKLANLSVATVAKGKPLDAMVKLQGPLARALQVSGEPVKVEAPAGKYTVSVEAEGYLSQTREVELAEAGDMLVTFDLQPEPKTKLVVVRENKIEILQQVHFATGKATILGDSHQLLDQVTDAIVRNNIKKIRVEGHTDNKGNKAKNLKLSQDRARAVGDYLIKKGVSPDAIETVGYGDTRPVAPNLTARGRELNRRVEFMIVEQ